MEGSNRTGGVRNIVDSGKNSIGMLPVSHTRVTRRVKPDQVSSYKLTVHKKPGETGGSDNTDRESDPGEIEAADLLPKTTRLLHRILSDRRGADKLFSAEFRYRTGAELTSKLRSAAIGALTSKGSLDYIQYLVENTTDFNTMGGVSSATWRNLIKDSSLDLIQGLMKSNVGGTNLANEVSVLSNTLLRKGINPLSYILKNSKGLLDGVRVADLPNQQVFNLHTGTTPSDHQGGSYSQGGIVDILGSKWIWTPNRDSNWVDKFMKKYMGHRIHISLQGFPAKKVSRSNTLKVGDNGLFNSYVHIAPSEILSVLGGFSITDLDAPVEAAEVVTKPVKAEVKDDAVVSAEITPEEEGWPWWGTIIPMIGQKLTPQASNVRGKLVKFSSYTNVLLPTGPSSKDLYGSNELDAHTSETYVWRGNRDKHKPYVTAEDSDILSAVYPHPLIRYKIGKYLNTWSDNISDLGSLAVATLAPVSYKT